MGEAPFRAKDLSVESQTFLYAAAFWIGAVVGRDTLVSEGANGWSGNHN